MKGVCRGSLPAILGWFVRLTAPIASNEFADFRSHSHEPLKERDADVECANASAAEYNLASSGERHDGEVLAGQLVPPLAGTKGGAIFLHTPILPGFHSMPGGFS
jgi:hypothetical protein